MAKSQEAFRTISEVAEWLDTPAHVLRFWESKFRQIKPVKRAGGRRYYRPEDMALLAGIKALLHDDGLTIKGAQKLLRDEGLDHVIARGEGREADATEPVPEAPAPTAPDVPEAAPEAPPETAAPGGASEVSAPSAAPEPPEPAQDEAEAPQESPAQTPAQDPAESPTLTQAPEADEPEQLGFGFDMPPLPDPAPKPEQAAPVDAAPEAATDTPAPQPAPKVTDDVAPTPSKRPEIPAALASDPADDAFAPAPRALGAIAQRRAGASVDQAALAPLVARLREIHAAMAAGPTPGD